MSDSVTGTGAGGARTRLGLAAWATGGLLLLQLGWLLVMPPATGIDEVDHLYRASSVALGHWQPPSQDEVPPELGRGVMLPVRADIAEAAGPACARLPYTGPFNCRPFEYLGGGAVEIASGAASYNPAYYVGVGVLARPWHGNAGIYAMRLVSIAGCALLFGLAVFLTTGWARTRWPVAMLLASCLPTTVYSASIAAPNGVELVGGILVWSSLAALLRGDRTTRSTAYSGLVVGASVLANTHTLGLLWLALVAVSLVTLTGASGALRLVLPRGRGELVALGLGVAALAFQVWWMFSARPNVSHAEGGRPGSPWGSVFRGLVLWPLQAVAAFPYRNEPASGAVYAAALAVLVCVVVLAARALRGQHRLAVTIAVTWLLSAAVPVAFTYVGFHQYGTSWQGRYGMPYSVGLFVLAGLALDRTTFPFHGPWLWLAAATWGLAHTVSLLGVLDKQRGDDVLVAATHWWAPPAALVAVVGVAAAAAWLRCLGIPPPAATGSVAGPAGPENALSDVDRVPR